MQDTPSSPPKWRRLLDLGRELVTQPEIAQQRELILEAAADLVEGEVTLWLNRSVYAPPEAKTPLDASQPPSAAMRRVLETERPIIEDTSAAFPFRVPSDVLGILEVRRPEAPPLSDDEIALLEGLATQAAAALQASRQIALERWRLEQLSVVRTVSAEVADILDLDELAHRVVNLVLHTFGYYYAALFILDPDQETLLCRASAGPAQSGAGENASTSFVSSVELGQGIVGHVAQTGEEILAGDVSREPHYRYVDVLPETKSEAALPLKIEERILGVLDVQSNQAERFDETDVLVLHALADQIAIAVEDARLYSDLRLHADQLSAVTEVSRVVASILDLDELLNQVVTLIHERFGYPVVHLFTVDPSRQKIVFRAGWPPHATEARQDSRVPCDMEDPESIVAWAACHGETVLSNDVREDSRYQRLAPPVIDAGAQLAVPLVFGDEVLGVLDVQSEHRGAFGDDDRFLFEALADSVAIAIRNANLYRSERWRRRAADSMRDVAGLLSAGIELDEVLDAILDRLGTLLPCDASAIWLLDEETLCLSAVHGADKNVCVSNALSQTNPWMRQALLSDQPIVRRSSAPPEPLGVTLDFDLDYSAIAAPLRAGERPLGLLTLIHHTPDRYGLESRAMTAAFASYAAVAIENTRLYQRAQEQAYISTVLLEVAEATQSLTTLDEVLGTVVRLMPMLVGVERCALFLWEEPEEAFAAVGACGLADEQQLAFRQVRIEPSAVPAFHQLHLTGEPVAVASESLASDNAALAPLRAFESPLLLPLLAHGEVLGAMLVDYAREQSGPEEDELHDERMTIMRGIAYQAAMAAENARLLKAQQEEAYVSAALLQVAQAVVSLTDLDEILEAIVRITPMLVGVERCTVFLWSDEEQVFRPAQGYGTSIARHAFAPHEFPLLDTIREQNQLINLKDADRIRELVPPQLAQELGLAPDGAGPSSDGAAALLGVPLAVKGNVLGAMLVGESDRRGHFDDRRLEIITGVAQQAALAVQNDLLQQEMAERERLERELQLAREIQQTFMPEHLPEPPGWELAVTWRAARQVAGDFYDVFELPGRRLGLVIADVADKGMPAALFMALTRTLMRAAAAEERSPANALTRVNDLLVPDAQHGMFVTGLYAILSVESGRLVYANAGHHPPLILRSDAARLEQLARGETALGVLAGVRFREHETSLAGGDCMALYTDGVTEALSPDGRFFGEDRLREVIERSGERDSAQGTLDGIVDALADFVGDNPPSDDLTLMVLRRRRA
jgi:GAF domain-containing protein